MSPSPGSPLCGGRVVAAGLVSGALGLAIALFLRSLAAATPMPPSEATLFWGTVLAVAGGLVAGMGLEAVRQLQRRNPDPAYRHGRRARRR